MRFPYGETVTVLQPQTQLDPYTEVERVDWTKPPGETSYSDCLVAPGGSGEPSRATRMETVTDYDVYMPHEVIIASRDRVRVRDEICEVVGRPERWPASPLDLGVVVHANVIEAT